MEKRKTQELSKTKLSIQIQVSFWFTSLFCKRVKRFFSRNARLGVFNFGDRRKHKTKTSWTVKIFFFRGTKIIIFLIRFFVMRYIYFLKTAMACVVLCTRARNLALSPKRTPPSLYNVSTCVLVWILFITYFPACTRVWRHDNIFVRLFNFDNNPEKFKSIKLKVTINQHATVDSALSFRLTYHLNAFLGSFELIDALPIWISTIS